MSNIESRTEPGTHDRFKMRPLSIRLLLKTFRVFQQTANGLGDMARIGLRYDGANATGVGCHIQHGLTGMG